MLGNGASLSVILFYSCHCRCAEVVIWSATATVSAKVQTGRDLLGTRQSARKLPAGSKSAGTEFMGDTKNLHHGHGDTLQVGMFAAY